MNPIEQLRDDLIARFPGITAEIDGPGDPAGYCVLDVKPGGGAPWIVVEWRSDTGFGVSTVSDADDDFGARPDELYPNTQAAFDRIARLLVTRGRTEPPTAVRLAELRQARGLLQADVAAAAGIKQAAVARAESRGDVLVSTVRRFVAAMGGELQLIARFPDGTQRELNGLGASPSRRARPSGSTAAREKVKRTPPQTR